MPFKIGIAGSAEGDFEKILDKAQQVGRILGKKGAIVITGASNGLPYEVAKVARKNGAEIWGYSKGTDLKSQEATNPELDSNIFTKLIYIPKDFEFANDPKVCMKYRNVIWTANCDGAILISGRWGTLNEFTNLFDMGKVIGVLTGTGGVADELENLSKKINKPSKAKIIFNSSPKALINSILKELSLRRKQA
ncbi:LOG family protein [Candidatus Daviesbacteria bacterium]|nr:LOG family protein [Candidatus Daviesbacteria bacterium]